MRGAETEPAGAEESERPGPQRRSVFPVLLQSLQVQTQGVTEFSECSSARGKASDLGREITGGGGDWAGKRVGGIPDGQGAVLPRVGRLGYCPL